MKDSIKLIAFTQYDSEAVVRCLSRPFTSHHIWNIDSNWVALLPKNWFITGNVIIGHNGIVCDVNHIGPHSNVFEMRFGVYE